MHRPALLSLATLGLLLTGCPDGEGPSTAGEETLGTTTILLPTSTDPGSSSGDPSASTSTTDEPGSSSGSSTTGFNCGEDIPPPIDPVVPRIILVLDKSGSMISKGKDETPGEVGDGFWDHDGDPNTPEITRWASLYSVVDSMTGGLDAVINFGAVIFPSTAAQADYSEAACIVEPDPLVPIGPMSGAAILAAIPPADATNLAGGTPAAAGVQVAVAELMDQAGDDPKIIVLVTDGAANCSQSAATNAERFEQYDDALPTAVADALAIGISTYVIGVDILDVTSPVVTDGNPDATNTYVKLNELAEAGGTPRPGDEKFYNASNQIELQAALESITKQILSCEIPLKEPVPNNFYIQRVEVGADGEPDQEVFTGMDTQVSDCATESGWMYTDETRAAIVLCGAACERYKETGVVSIEYGCFQG